MPVKKSVREMSRRDIRYRLYRLKNDKPVDKADGLKKHYESQDAFDGWHNFGVTWDVGRQSEWPDGQFVCVPLSMSLEEEWQRTVLGLARSLPTPTDEEE